MEDAYSFVVDFGGVRGQGYFAIFDGHAGKHAAEWCGAHFHEVLLETLEEKEKEKDNGGEGGASVPEIMNSTFHQVDFKLSQLAESGETHSGCTAVTAFLRLEDINGGQAFVLRGSSTSPTASTRSSISSASPSKLKSVLKSISPNSNSNSSTSTSATSSTIDPDSLPSSQQSAPIEPPYDIRRVLYLANVGDARAVLSRGGKAVRLTYDHKGSDKQEARRIKEAGGFVMNNRVNGMRLVTLIEYSEADEVTSRCVGCYEESG
jgi:protein phosphatase PTC1